MGHVGQGIGHLRRTERAAAPVGEARGLVHLRPGDLAHQGLVAGLVAVAADHRRHLGVEERLRQHPGLGLEDLQVLPRGVKDLHHPPVAEELVERVERQPVGERVDQHGALVALAGPGELHQAELRVVGPLAQELGVDRHVGVARSFGTEPGQRVGLGDGRQPAAPEAAGAADSVAKSGTCNASPMPGRAMCGTAPEAMASALAPSGPAGLTRVKVQANSLIIKENILR